MAETMIHDETERSNQELLQRCRSNDPEAYHQFFSLYNRRIYNTAYRILGEESSAEDALQETLLNVYKGLSSFRGESKISTWISRITVNVCLGMLRKGKNRHFVELEQENAKEIAADPSPYLDPLEHASAAELRGVIDETFSRMTEKQRIVVRLHDFEGHTIQEVARLIGCPAGTVKSRLFYGRQEFKGIFESLLRCRVRPKVQ